MKLMWSKQVSEHYWKGIVGGPIEAITEFFGAETWSLVDSNLGYEMKDMIAEGLTDCPIFKSKVQ
jgi:hypothetical protein